METKGWLTEIYSANQGEGQYIGYRQIFVRFAECNLKCDFCDTIISSPYLRYEDKPNSRIFNKIKNPVEVAKVEKIISSLAKLPHHSISLTGGEPLLQVEFLKVLLSRLKKKGFKIYLETNGTLALEVKDILPWIDIISMDIKLKSVSGNPPLWKKHRDFLKKAAKKDLSNLSRTGLDLFVKLVVSKKMALSDLKKASRLLLEFSDKIPVYLQPVTGKYTPSVRQLFSWQSYFLENHKTVRVIPQMHKIVGDM